MKYYKWFAIVFAALVFAACREAWGFTPTVYQCPVLDAFIVYYIKDGQIVSIVGAGGTSYLACEGNNCTGAVAKEAEEYLYSEAKKIDTARMVDLNKICN